MATAYTRFLLSAILLLTLKIECILNPRSLKTAELVKKRDRIKTIFFDAADTLFYIRRGLGHTYAEVARKYGADPDPSDIKKAFSRAFKSAPPLAFGNVSDDRKEEAREGMVEVYRGKRLFGDRYVRRVRPALRRALRGVQGRGVDALSRNRRGPLVLSRAGATASASYPTSTRGCTTS